MTLPEAPPSVTVTGASGFLGRAVVKELRSSGFGVLPVARSSGGDWNRIPDYSGSPSADILIHLAEDSDRRRVNDEGEMYEAAANATFKALLAKGYRRVVYASSAAIYGDASQSPRMVSEAVAAADTYARAKLANETLALAHGGSVLRFSNLYGPGMSPANVVSAILRQVPGAGDLVLHDDSPVRDFLWIEDAAAAIAAAVSAGHTGLFNVGTGSGTSIGKLAEIALSLAGEEHREIRVDNPSDRISTLILDIGETTRRIGWRPVTSIGDGMERLITRPPNQP